MPDALDNLVPASFRGVSFLAPERTRESGRRGDVAEQPHTDVPYALDTGRKARTFRLRALVFTHEGYEARDALINALEQYGAGRYVDPWGGEWIVKVTRWTCRESTARGGLAEFQIELAEDGEQALGVYSIIDTKYEAINSALDLIRAVSEAFVRIYAYVSQPDRVRGAAETVLKDFSGHYLSDASRWDTVRAVELNDARALLLRSGEPGRMADNVAQAISATADAIHDPEARTRFLLQAADYAFSPVTSARPTTSRARAVANQIAVASLIRRAALGVLTRRSPDLTWESYDAALAYAERASAAFHREIALASGREPGLSSGEAFRALTRAEAMVVQDARQRGAALARLSRVRLPGALPAAVLAYRLYDNARRAPDLARRNGIRDLNWLPPGVDLEVLST